VLCERDESITIQEMGGNCELSKLTIVYGSFKSVQLMWHRQFVEAAQSYFWPGEASTIRGRMVGASARGRPSGTDGYTMQDDHS
jgi:hypothetical protein